MLRQIAASLLIAAASHTHAQSEFLAVGWSHFGDQPEGKRICMFSPDDGSFLGYLTDQFPDTITWVQGIAYGPDDHIYLADQVNDTVTRFSRDGELVDFFLTAADGIENIRGLAFLGEDLLIAHAARDGTSAVDYKASQIKRFAPDGTEKTPIATGFSSWDIHTINDTKLIVSESLASFSDQVHVYDEAGNDLSTVFTANWPTGFSDSHTPGNYYGVGYTRTLREFNESSVIRSLTMAIPSSTIAKDVYPLNNGNILVTTFSEGVHVINPANGQHVLTAHTGYGFGNITLVGSPSCHADVNDDGEITPTDFTAWINAFNNSLPECDQNADNACSPTDFTAWIDNYNTGC
ncbi:MAG: hypothetical protein Phyf2KO_07770 [Phycisphaerales bacterium]